MAILDAGLERSHPLSDWVRFHGAATALMGCIAFWATLATSLYFIF